MAEGKFRVKSISRIHDLMGLGKPKHPQITLVDASLISVTEEQLGVKLIHECYMISLKDKSCGMEYGRNTFDFDEGVMV
ncbi:MAG: AraC family transcriptional regulator, partial [Bacteroidota bacterium]